ncbi:MAG: hypothetical protein GY865_10160, partial [candidate division Zixibacteria bacterium]|nr:hypothetical protein [candidate division Zixibacteria bacterium]
YREYDENKVIRQFEILRDIAVLSADSEKISSVAKEALQATGKLINLSAATLMMWDNQNQPTMNISYADSALERQLLQELETEIFSGLRKERELVSAYVSFGGTKPMSTFTQPIKIGDTVFGAVIGIQSGSGRLVRDDYFLEALTAALSVSISAGGIAPPTVDDSEKMKKERLNAIIETAATVNHEINNPLTAVLGNVQLLLMRGGELDDETIRKLKVVEESAIRIKEVTQKLMKISNDNVTEYTSGSKMIDLSDDENPQ